MQKSEGFSLLEATITLLISSLFLLSFFSLVDQLNTWTLNLGLLLERDSNLWLSPLLLSRWILGTGNNHWQQAWKGVNLRNRVLELKSDIDGPRGFPDLELASSFEKLVLRCSPPGLQVKSGEGSFQPLLGSISSFQVEDSRMPLLRVRLSAATVRPLFRLKESASESAEIVVLLRNYRPNLFSEKPP